MREILEEAALTYRQEVESVLTLAAPTAVLGLVLLIVSSTGLAAAFAATVALLLVFLVAYAACIQWASASTTSRGYNRGVAWPALLQQAPHIVLAAAPGIVLLAIVGGTAALLGREGFWYLGVGVGLFGLVAFARWAMHHQYDLPLVIVYEARAPQAMSLGPQLVDADPDWSFRLLSVVCAPLFLVSLLSAGVAFVTVPMAGAAVFLLALAFWLPFAGMSLTLAAVRLVEEADSARREPAREMTLS
jgi:hypothetical protein